MKRSYQTLDDYLDDLDKIKEGIAEETEGLNPEQVQAYFARARRELEKAAGRKPRPRKAPRKAGIRGR